MCKGEAGVPLCRAVAGFAPAPGLPRRTARRESGSTLSERERKRLAKSAY
ncbi:hypothetical protein [Streptomyces sp. CBMA123]|nr:hypothetical protein [Streptomyces sp. CBMA123]